jgi:O-antigen ligase
MIAVACAAVGLGAAWRLGVLPAALTRFQGETELRTEFWRTTLSAIPLYWPYGSGIGTFKTVFPLVESLESVSPFVVNQAHNDYLQLVLEGGAASAALLLVFGIFFGVRGFRLFGGATAADLSLSRAAWLGMAVLLTHSLVDYPLRNASLLALFGLLASLLVPAPRPWRSAAKTIAA